MNWIGIKSKYLETHFDVEEFVVDDIFEFIEGQYERNPDLEQIKNKYLEENSFEVEESDLDDIIEFIEKNLTI